AWVESSPDWERLAPVPFSTVCFRACQPETAGEEGLDRLNERLLEEVNRAGRVYLSHKKLRGQFTLRLSIGSLRTTREHVRVAWDELNGALERCRGGGGA